MVTCSDVHQPSAFLLIFFFDQFVMHSASLPAFFSLALSRQLLGFRLECFDLFSFLFIFSLALLCLQKTKCAHNTALVTSNIKEEKVHTYIAAEPESLKPKRTKTKYKFKGFKNKTY